MFRKLFLFPFIVLLLFISYLASPKLLVYLYITYIVIQNELDLKHHHSNLLGKLYPRTILLFVKHYNLQHTQQYLQRFFSRENCINYIVFSKKKNVYSNFNSMAITYRGSQGKLMNLTFFIYCKDYFTYKNTSHVQIMIVYIYDKRNIEY